MNSDSKTGACVLAAAIFTGYSAAASGDVVLISNTLSAESEAIGGGGASPFHLGPVVMDSGDPFSNTVDNTLATGVQDATDGLMNFRGTGSGTGIAQGNSAVDVGLVTMSGDLTSIAQFAATPDLGVGLGESDASIKIVFTTTTDTDYTLDASITPVIGGFAGTDAFTVRLTSQIGNPIVHLINNAVPGDIAGASGTFLAGKEYTIFLVISNITSGGPAQSPGSLETIASFLMSFESGTLIREKCHIADINNDNVVDTADLGILLGAFGTNDHFADLNGDGVVDTADLGILLGAFGTSCP